MAKNIRTKIIPVILIVALIFAGGCWDKRELNTLAIITGIGIDSYKGNTIKLTAQILKAQSNISDSGQPKNASTTFNIKSKGKTIFFALRQLTHMSSRRIYFSHNRVIIYGEKIARKGIHNYLDIFARNPETRPLTYIFVAKGKASDILKTKSYFGSITSDYIGELIQNQSMTSTSLPVHFDEFLVRFMSKTTAPIAPAIEVIKKSKKATLNIMGLAAFRHNRLAGFFNSKSSRGILWTIGKTKSGVIQLSVRKNAPLAIEIKSTNSTISPRMRNGHIYMNVTINASGKIVEKDANINITNSFVNSLQKKMENYILSEVKSSITKAKKLRTDVFGFGEIIYRKYPAKWKGIENDWESIFPKIKVSVTVNAQIPTTGQINNILGK